MPVIALTSAGRTVAVDADDDVLEQVRPRLPPGWRPAGGRPVERTWSCVGGTPSVDGVPLGTWADQTTATEVLIGDLELWLAEHARRRVYVHAGCVVWQGRAVLLPGRTLAGKSTLTAALVRAGATYYSDEYAVLGPDGRVRPYPRPLALRPRSDEAPRASRRVPVVELGGRAGRTPAPVALVALLQFTEGASYDVQDLSPGQTVLGLLDNTVPARTRPRAVMNALALVGGSCRGVKGIRGNAEDAAAQLLEALA